MTRTLAAIVAHDVSLSWRRRGSLLGSVVFAIYVRNFNSFGEAYGAIGGVVVMLMWFYVSAYVFILGGEINSELERQTVHDTTTGEPKPLGKRGAFSADTVGPRGWEWRRAHKH